MKESDTRAQGFIKKHGRDCAELDAIPSSEIRQRLREAIEDHIPQDEWEKLKETEELEKQTFAETLGKLKSTEN